MPKVHRNTYAIFGLTILLFIAPFTLNSKEVSIPIPKDFPKEFMMNGKPINPICVEFNGDSSRFDPVDLQQCSKKIKYKLEDINKIMIGKGFYGFDYTSTSDGFESHMSSYYKILGQYKDHFILYGESSTGGSGYFSNLIYVKRNGNTIKLEKEIAAGDRCNGSLDSNITFKDNIVRYKQNITPYDMLALSELLPEKIKAYDDLAACAACCIGQASYEYHVEADKFKLISVEMNKLEAYNTNEQGQYQVCFNKILMESQAKNKFNFNVEELKELTREFLKRCYTGSSEEKQNKKT